MNDDQGKSTEERLRKLEQTALQLAQMVSEQGGEANAYRAALLGVLMGCGAVPQLRSHIEQQIERATAIHLAGSTNPLFMEGFDHACELVRLALDEGGKRAAHGEGGLL